MSERSVLIINFMCALEQNMILLGSIYLIGWQGWSPWWFAVALLLMFSAAPSVILEVLNKWVRT